MTRFLRNRLILRLMTLTVLTLCLVIVSRHNSDAHLATTSLKAMFAQAPAPIVKVQTQLGSPLAVSAPRIVNGDKQHAEIAFDLINVSGQPIRAYAIKEEVEVGGTRSTKVLFSNLDLANSPRLQRNQSITNFDTFDLTPSQTQEVTLSVDYVEFSDGTHWGSDSAKSIERSAGQRVAAQVLSKRLRELLNVPIAGDLISAIDTAAASIEPPAARSEEWKDGFRLACKSIASYLKRAQAKGGLNQVELELRRFNESFSRGR